MNKDVFKFLNNNVSTEPKYVDRLIVSAFIKMNDISVVHNALILDNLISDKGDEEFNDLTQFIELFGNKNLGFEELIELFEFVISPEEKIVNGAIYTPRNIRDYIIDNAFENYNFKTLPQICDPACGCSGFLYSAALKIRESTKFSFFEIFKNSLFGVDIEHYSVQRSKLLLSLLALSEGEDLKEFKFNIYQGNSLEFDWKTSISNFNGFTHVVGNPPYVCSRNIDSESKRLLENWEVCSTGHPDLYIPFFEIGMRLLKANGILGFITMNSFFKSLNGRALRSYFDRNRFDFRIIDFGSNQVFKSKSTYTCICLIQNQLSNKVNYYKLKSNELSLSTPISFNEVPYDCLNPKKGWNLNEYKILNKIENTGVPLGELFRSRNGIATLKNDLYIFSPVKEDNEYYYLQNGKTYPIEKSICKDIINPNKLIDTKSIDNLKMKVIYPYIQTSDKVVLMDESKFQSNYPRAYVYLSDKKPILAKRDKGKGKYENWYAYGRNQSLEKLKYKLFFPHITPKTPSFIINTDENLLFHNGLALIAESRSDLLFIKKVMTSRLFWFYIINSSRNYGSEYYSLSKIYFKNFGIYPFSKEEKEYIISENNADKLNSFIENAYSVKIPSID